MRLINANELRKAIESLPNCYNGFSDTYDKACIIRVIDDQPTIDPVKHGKWIMYPTDAFTYHCSECKHMSGVHANYCPDCGAKMDK